MPESLVIIPTYNEIENIERMLDTVMSLERPFDVLIVDDGSPDGTAEKVREKMSQHKGRIHIEERTGKLGLGTAYIHGFKWALARDYDYIFEMDCDFSHNPEDLPRLQEACERGAGVAIGSRYVKGVNVVNWPMSRVLLSYFARTLESIDFSNIQFVGYAFQIEMKFTAWRKGIDVVEVPVIFTDRTEGESKMSSGIIKEAIFGVIKLKLRSFFTKA